MSLAVAICDPLWCGFHRPVVNFGCPFPSSRAESIDFVVKTIHQDKSLAFLRESWVSERTWISPLAAQGDATRERELRSKAEGYLWKNQWATCFSLWFSMLYFCQQTFILTLLTLTKQFSISSLNYKPHSHQSLTGLKRWISFESSEKNLFSSFPSLFFVFF